MSSNERVLLINADSGELELVSQLLAQGRAGRRETLVEGSIAAALERLEGEEFDVILAALPDDGHTDAIARLARAARGAPLVVLMRETDEAVGLGVLRAGAHDFLCTRDINPLDLERALAFALARRRQGERDELKLLIDRYRVSISGLETEPTGPAPEPDGSVHRRHPELLRDIDAHYQRLLTARLEHDQGGSAAPLELVASLAASLSDLEAGRRDVLGIHVRAIERSVRTLSPEQVRAFVRSAQSAALEVMAAMVDRYRARVQSDPPPG